MSPLVDEAAWVSEETLYLTTLQHDELKVEDYGIETKSELASKLLDDLDKLEDLDEWIKGEETFQNWLDDDKIIPILDTIDAAQCSPTPVKLEEPKHSFVPDTNSFLMEFERIRCIVEMEKTLDTLTPPQSPPYKQPLLTPLQPVSMPVQEYVPCQPEFQPIGTPAPDVLAHELAVVDELVRLRAEKMVQWEGPASPCSNSSGSSNFGDCSSDDPEWMPEASSDQEKSVGPVKNQRKRASKPYSRPTVEDKKSRKKEQNKNAATRYRMKKKAEVEEILEEERGLLKHHDELNDKITDLGREISYLKGLMRDLFKAKGLIN